MKYSKPTKNNGRLESVEIYEEKRREKLSITAAREPLTFAEKEQLRKEMEASKWASKSW